MNKLIAFLQRWRLSPKSEPLTTDEEKLKVKNEVENYRRRIRALEIQAQVQRGKR